MTLEKWYELQALSDHCIETQTPHAILTDAMAGRRPQEKQQYAN